MIKKHYINTFIIGLIFLLFLFKNKHTILNIKEGQLCSIKNPNTTVFHGPNITNKKARIILKKNYPIYILKIKKNWVKIIDHNNKTGWILKDNISTKQYGMIKRKIKLKEENVILMPNISVEILSIFKQHCVIKVDQKIFKINITDIWLKPDNISNQD